MPEISPLTHHEALIARLDGTVEAALAPLLEPGKPFVLIGFPYYPNIGDSAIWAGEGAFFARHGLTPAAVSLDGGDVAALRAAVGDGTLFLCGGGNFGDIWPTHQDMRDTLCREFPGNRIVQLPQSIHFEDPSRLAATAEAIREHGQFTLLVRDHPSLELARAHFHCDLALCPDMAFCLGPQERRSVAIHDLLVLARTDHEAASAPPEALPPGTLCIDWAEEPANLVRDTRRKVIATSPFALGLRVLDKDAQRERFWRHLAMARVERGLELLSSARAVATDRLHAHILCMLLGVPHAVADNNYGKVGHFIEAWTAGSPLVRRAGDLQEAVGMLGAELNLAG